MRPGVATLSGARRGYTSDGQSVGGIGDAHGQAETAVGVLNAALHGATADEEGDEPNHQEDEEQNLRNSHGRSGHSTETQDPGDQRDDEKN